MLTEYGYLVSGLVSAAGPPPQVSAPPVTGYASARVRVFLSVTTHKFFALPNGKMFEVCRSDFHVVTSQPYAEVERRRARPCAPGAPPRGAQV
ncbi:hypothetical protein EVAR_14106_1 [Eumeta japonica]|uniref:Uncharacterized protein n=1 Tax=Eumeta variegata TaxID=151549 RepID=A0A4C1UNB6_EUMVA|nr:hypothetical protein EVAR_14106_1 [Eumeta japonica]